MTASGSGCCRGAGSNFNQYTASITVNILTFSHGATLGWLSPFLPLLESAESPMNTGPITVEQASWIGSLLCVGEVFGMVLFYVLTRVLGKKAALQLSVITHFGFWMLVYFGEEVYLLYIARFMTGVTGGALLLCVPLFVADIAELSIRGLLSSMLAGASTLGIFVGYCTGAFFSYTTVPLIMLIAPVIYSLILCMFPDTPYSLLKRNRPEKAMKSLQFYRNLSDADVLGNENFQNEFNNLKNSYAKEVENSSKRAFNLGDFTNKEGRKGLTLGILLMILNQVSGGFTILNYSATIFASAGATNWSPNDSAMFIGFIQLVGCIISTGLVDKVGRKILLLVSLISVAIGLAALGVYSYLQEINIDVTNYTWVPVATLSFVFFMTAIGIYGLPFVLLAEVLPLNIRNIGSTICVIVVAVAAFISLKIFPILLKDIQLHGCMWGYAALTVIGTVTIAFCLPETKGKDLFAAGQKPK